MKRFLAALNLLLCLELIMAPVAPQIKFFGSSKAVAESCPAGYHQDPGTGRCQMSEETAKLQQSAKNCDPSDSACFKANAENLFQQKVNSGEAKQNEKEMDEFTSKFMSAAVIAVPMAISTDALASLKSPCASVSYWAMVTGSVSLFVGDLWTNFAHGRKVKDIQKDWRGILSRKTNTSGMNADDKRSHISAAQSEAFEMLARSEDAMEKTSSLKSKFYALAAAAYATSAVTAGLEVAGLHFVNMCTPDPTPPTEQVAAREALKKASSDAITEAGKADEALLKAKIAEADAGFESGLEMLRPEGVTQEAADAALRAAQANTAAAQQAADAANSMMNATVQNAQNATNALNFANTAQGAQAATQATIDALGIGSNAAIGVAAGVGSGAAGGLGNSQDVPEPPRYHDLPANTPIIHYIPQDSRDMEMIKKQNEYNISQAKNIASFFVLKQAEKYKYSSPSIEDYEKYNGAYDEIEKETPELLDWFKFVSKTVAQNLNPIQNANADEQAENIAIGIAGSLAMTWAVKKYLGGWLVTPVGRLSASSLFAGWSLIMFNHAKSQASASKNRANVLREIRAQFVNANDGMNPCDSKDRQDPAQPYCYCYTPDNKRNSSRYSSQICQKLWTGIVASSTNYFGAAPDQYRGCIDTSRMHDPACKCKTSPAGCMKVIPSNISMNPGTFSMVSSGLGPANQMANGTFNPASVNGDAVANSAVRMLKKAEDIIKKKGLEKKLAESKKKMAGLEKSLIAKTAGASIPSLGGSNSRIPMTPAEAVKDLEKELKKNEPEIGNVGGGNETVATPENKPEENLEFGLTEGQAAAQDAQVAEVMKQNLDFGQNDIQGSNTNLFEVLTNRYQRSGMRRLFDDEGKTQADKPANSDITK